MDEELYPGLKLTLKDGPCKDKFDNLIFYAFDKNRSGKKLGKGYARAVEKAAYELGKKIADKVMKLEGMEIELMKYDIYAQGEDAKKLNSEMDEYIQIFYNETKEDKLRLLDLYKIVPDVDIKENLVYDIDCLENIKVGLEKVMSARLEAYHGDLVDELKKLERNGVRIVDYGSTQFANPDEFSNGCEGCSGCMDNQPQPISFSVTIPIHLSLKDILENTPIIDQIPEEKSESKKTEEGNDSRKKKGKK